MTWLLFAIAVVVAVVAGLRALGNYIAWQNAHPGVTAHTYQNDKFSPALDGFRILQISDLHNTEFGEDNNELLALVKDAQPDIIAITGDIIDKRHFDLPQIKQFITALTCIAPVYYVTGNHEEWMGRYAELEVILREGGVAILDEAQVELPHSDGKVLLMGARDPDFYIRHHGEQAFAANLQARMTEVNRADQAVILLSHRSELLPVYAQAGVDLVLTGHAHGGQVRLPGMPGLFAPDQGFFPQYTGGEYRQDDTTMIVSRGLASLYFPPRIFNRPELVLVVLKP